MMEANSVIRASSERHQSVIRASSERHQSVIRGHSYRGDARHPQPGGAQDRAGEHGGGRVPQISVECRRWRPERPRARRVECLAPSRIRIDEHELMREVITISRNQRP